MEAGEERTCVIHSLDEGVNCVSVCLNSCSNNSSVLILQLLGSLNRFSSSRYSNLIRLSRILNCKSNIMNSISMYLQVLCKLRISRIQGTSERKSHLSIPHNMRAVVSRSCLQALIGDVIKPKSRSVERSSLLSIRDIQSCVIKSKEFTYIGSLSRSFVIH